MTISAKIIADSISPAGHRLTTFQLRYPRFIHAEAKTHRIITIDGIQYEETIDMGFMDDPKLSRNASSSRAIPVKKMIEDLRRDPAMPVFWGSNKPGMQAGDELLQEELANVKRLWLRQMEQTISVAEILMEQGLHKQIANRILEPWAHINVVVTATDYANFFKLRRHPDAQPEIKVLADAMWEEQQSSVPHLLQPGEWHLPYVTECDRKESYHGPSQTPEINALKQISAARCARVSYLTHDGRQTTWEEDQALYQRLVRADVIHASPTEHQATPDEKDNHGNWLNPTLHGNLNGFVQFRKTLDNEFTAG